jgi:hypothetical protein
MVSMMTDAAKDNENYTKRRYGNPGLNTLESLYFDHACKK